MSKRLQTAAIFALVSVCSCVFFLAMGRDSILYRAGAVESPGKSTVKLREPATVVVAPRVTQSVKLAETRETPEADRERSFYNQGAGKTSAADPAGATPDVFPVASPDAREIVDPRYSVWARFPAGSWSRRRAESTSVENGKRIQSATETRFLLKSVDYEKKRYVLQCDTTIKMGDVDFPKRTELVEYNFWDMIADDEEREEDAGAANLMIGSRVVPCRVRRVIRESDRVREVTTIWFSPVVAPYVLQRETTRKPLDSNAKEPAVRELYVVQSAAVDSPANPAPVASEALFSRHDGSSETTGSSLRSTAIPGAVVRESDSESGPGDEESLYQTKTTLLDYYVAP